jgi:hypothetical protein
MDGNTWGALSVGIGGTLVFITAAQKSVHRIYGGSAYPGWTTRRSRFLWACQIIGSALVLIGSLLLLAASSDLAVVGCTSAAIAVALALWSAMAFDLKRVADQANESHPGWWFYVNCWRDRPLGKRPDSL